MVKRWTLLNTLHCYVSLVLIWPFVVLLVIAIPQLLAHVASLDSNSYGRSASNSPSNLLVFSIQLGSNGLAM